MYLERVLVLSALMEALEDSCPRCQVAAAWRAQAAGFGCSVRAPLFPALMERRLMQHECLPAPFTPLSSLVRLQLSWDPKSVFSPTSAMFIFLGTSCNTGELGAYKSGQEV